MPTDTDSLTKYSAILSGVLLLVAVVGYFYFQSKKSDFDNASLSDSDAVQKLKDTMIKEYAIALVVLTYATLAMAAFKLFKQNIHKNIDTKNCLLLAAGSFYVYANFDMIDGITSLNGATTRSAIVSALNTIDGVSALILGVTFFVGTVNVIEYYVMTGANAPVPQAKTSSATTSKPAESTTEERFPAGCVNFERLNSMRSRAIGGPSTFVFN